MLPQQLLPYINSKEQLTRRASFKRIPQESFNNFTKKSRKIQKNLEEILKDPEGIPKMLKHLENPERIMSRIFEKNPERIPEESRKKHRRIEILMKSL